MRELFDVMLRLTWTVPLAAMRQLVNIFSLAWMENATLGSAGTNISQQTGPTLQTGVHPPAEVVSPALAGHSSSAAGTPFQNTSSSTPFANLIPVNHGNLNTSRMVVLGEGLAAGVGDFALHAETQPFSFPAQMARQMAADFSQRLIQPPGIGNFTGFASLPVRVPAPMQSTVLEQLPPQPVSNLSIPEFRLEDAFALRPAQPLIQRKNTKQTSVNLVWGILPIAQGQESLPTQVEYALQQSPTFVVVELGYYEALEAAINGDPERLPSTSQFISGYTELLSILKRSGAEILVLNIPSPFHTAYFSSVEVGAKITKVAPSFLLGRYGIKADDLITANGLNEISFQILRKSLHALPPDSILSSTIAQVLTHRIDELNHALARLAEQNGVVLYDLAALFSRVASEGSSAGGRILTSEYLGGFYLLNGYYPGQTGQAIIANEILGLLNTTYAASFPLIDLNAVAGSDPTVASRQALGPTWPSSELAQLPFTFAGELNECPVVAQTAEDNHFNINENWEQLAPVTPPVPSKLPLELPPSLEQVLPLSTAASYFGDGISALNVRNPQQAFFGSTGNSIFGGLAMVDSHLSGSIKIKFTPPANRVSHFEISFMSGFSGADSVLATPQFFKMPFRENRVDEVPGLVSAGDLNLETGEVGNLTVYARYISTALSALINVNPNFPKGPNLPYPVIVFKNPPPSNCPPPTPEERQIYASARAQFEQRPDGKLDFTFYGSMFVPLGPTTVWPLNFVGPSGQFATIVSPGTVMHPHLQLSTRDPEPSGEDFSRSIPFNTIQEFTLFTHNSAFGDAFTLSSPVVGGAAKGRSHLLGRLQIQFGPRTQNSVPLAVWAVPPGGIMAPLPDSPITQSFPSRLSAGPQGFNEFLRFPLRTYPLDDLSIVDDPFDISVGALDLGTGRLLNSLLHRAFISQDLIFALLRVEPCTPQSSFFFHGPAVLARGPRNQKVLRYQGIVHIPYPAGLKFPYPDFSTGFTVGGDSALDPYLWFHAIQNESASGVIKKGGASRVRASTGDEFSYRYLIPSDPFQTAPVFEYENHSQQGSFHMHSLAWVDFTNSGTSQRYEEPYDTVTFSGFGVWRKDGIQTLQQVAVQVSTSSEKPYVGIQVAAGDVSNVNTKPENEQAALP
jgi:hypothetical protein